MRRKEEQGKREKETRGQYWSCLSRGAVEAQGSNNFRSLAERPAALRVMYDSGLDSRPNAPRNRQRSWRAMSASPPSGPIRDKPGGDC